MLRRGTDTQRATTDDAGLRPAPPAAATTGAAGPVGLGDWAAPRSYLELDRDLVAELVRVALASPKVASIRNGELAVGAMLASLAIRGEDALVDELLPLTGVELRLHRYAVGRLDPIAVHPVGSLAEMLRSLARCAVQPQGETWEAVANDGRSAPVAVAAARNLELRWLQPPAADSPHDAPWAPLTSQSPAPGASVAEWQDRLAARPVAPAAPSFPAAPLPPIRLTEPILPSGTTAASEPVPAFGPAPAASGPRPDELVPLIEAAVERALANAPLELDLDAATLDELRDTTVIERLVDAVGRLDQQVGQVDALSRQVAALTAAIDDLADANRSLLRHEWDNLPPQGFWVRIQKADDELRRSIDELANEVRGRRRTP
jgi:hypothetical protein